MSALRGNGWSKVPPGELSRLGARLRLHRFFTTFVVPGLLFLAAAVTVTAATWVATDPDLWAGTSPQPCTDCQAPTVPSCHGTAP
jgi:hypothetical protein